jgi:hypothetical protein
MNGPTTATQNLVIANRGPKDGKASFLFIIYRVMTYLERES